MTGPVVAAGVLAMNIVSTEFCKRAAVVCVVTSSAVLLSVAPGFSQMLGTPAPGAAPASGLDYRDPAQAPPSWAQFSKLVKYRFETLMGAGEPLANGVRAY